MTLRYKDTALPNYTGLYFELVMDEKWPASCVCCHRGVMSLESNLCPACGARVHRWCRSAVAWHNKRTVVCLSCSEEEM